MQPLLAGVADARWVVVARDAAVALLLLLSWSCYSELRESRVAAGAAALAIATGAAVFAAWIHLDAGWASFELGPGFVPLRADGSVDPLLAAARLAGLVLVVPLMEELFWRSLVMRWIRARDFLRVDPRQAGLAAFALSSGLFALEHSQWLAGLIAGLAYGWLYMRTGNLWIPLISHATTNGLLGLWILATGSWRFW